MFLQGLKWRGLIHLRGVPVSADSKRVADAFFRKCVNLQELVILASWIGGTGVPAEV